MLDLPSIIGRLALIGDENDVAAFARIGVVTDLAQVLDGITALPAAFVRPGTDTPREAQNPAFPRHVVDERVEVILVVRNVSDANGAEAAVELKALADAVRAALLGFVPSGRQFPLVFEGGKPLGMNDMSLVWAETYRTQTNIKPATN